MKLFVNARFLTQPLSGVQRYGIECSRQIKMLLPDTIFLCPNNVIHTYVAKELDAKIIGKRTGHKWEQFDLPVFLAGQQSPPLFNPANTAPLFYENNFLTLHDLAFFHHPEWNSKLFSAWYNFLIPKIVRRSKHIFTVSNFIKEEIERYYHIPEGKISVTYNGIARQMLEQAPIISKQKIILSVGSFSTRKNHHKLIEAFIKSGLKDEYQLVIIGDKHKVFKDTNLNEDTIINNNIKIYRRLSDEKLINLYISAELLVSLSLYEGFGIPLLEGIYYDCRILCADIEVYRELFTNYATFCDPNDANAVGMALLNAIKDIEKAPDENSMRKTLLLEKLNYREAARVIVDQVLKQ